MRGKEESMFGRNGIHGWKMKIAVLVREATHILLNQLGESQDEEAGEFLNVVVEGFLPGVFCFFSL